MNRFATIVLVIVAIVAMPFSVLGQEAGRACDQSIAIQQAPGIVEIIPAVPGTQIIICGWFLSTLATTGVTAQFSSNGVSLTGAMVMKDSAPAEYALPVPVPYNQPVTLTTNGGVAAGAVSFRR